MPLPTMDYQTPRPRRIWSWRDLLFFRAPLAPLAIQLLFWFGLAAILWHGGLIIYSAFYSYYGFVNNARTTGWSFYGPVLINGFEIIILGPIVLRITCELLLLVFRLLQRYADKDPSTDRDV